MTEQKSPHFDYVSEAHLTASPQFNHDMVPLFYFLDVVRDAIAALDKLDKIKKTLFYGRPLEIKNIGATFANCSQVVENLIGNDPLNPVAEHEALNIIHGIIGKATEAGELLEALFETAAHGTPFDRVNAGEEVGDGFWYDALILRAIGSTFNAEQRRNIAKLRARYPDKFTSYDANNRDLFEERKILENNA